jgi:hypothetical protein
MNFKEVSRQIDSYNRTRKEKILAFICALILSLLVISAPVLLLINFGIYKNYLKLIVFIAANFFILVYFLIQYLYYNGITEGEVKGIWIVCLHDTIIPLILVYGLVIILFLVGVV